MRTFRWLVVGVAAALLMHAGTAAAAPPDFWAAAKLCEAQGSTRFLVRGRQRISSRLGLLKVESGTGEDLGRRV